MILRKCVYASAIALIQLRWGDCLYFKDAIVKRFNLICAKRGIKLNELATLAGVTPSTVYSMVESSRRELSVTTVKKLLDGLEITVREFFDDSVFDELEQEIK